MSADAAGAGRHNFQTLTRAAVASDHASIETERSNLVFQEIVFFLLQMVSNLSWQVRCGRQHGALFKVINWTGYLFSCEHFTA